MMPAKDQPAQAKFCSCMLTQHCFASVCQGKLASHGNNVDPEHASSGHADPSPKLPPECSAQSAANEGPSNPSNFRYVEFKPWAEWSQADLSSDVPLFWLITIATSAMKCLQISDEP